MIRQKLILVLNFCFSAVLEVIRQMFCLVQGLHNVFFEGGGYSYECAFKNII